MLKPKPNLVGGEETFISQVLNIGLQERLILLVVLNSAFMNLIARLILNTKCEIAVFTSVIVLCVLNQI